MRSRVLFATIALLALAGCDDDHHHRRAGATPSPVPSTAAPTSTLVPQATTTASRTTTAAATPTASASRSATPTPTSSSTSTFTPSATASPTSTETPTFTLTPTLTPTPSASPTVTPTATLAIRRVPYDVRDTAQPGQLTVYNGKVGGGSVGMPVRFGDVNGDGNGDYVSCPMLADGGAASERRDSGEVHIYYGTGEIDGVIVNTPEASGITTLTGARAGDLLSNEPHVVDVDRDGFADLLLGAQNYDGPQGDRQNAGGVFFYRGGTATPRTVDMLTPPSNVVVITGAAPGDRLGIWVASGDLDGDGDRDLILGADQVDAPGGGRMDAGAIYVIFGGQTLPASIDLAAPGALRIAVIYGIDAGDHFGSTVVAADLDRDGRDDLVAAAGLARGSSQIEGTFLAGGDGPENARPDAGDVYLLFSADPFPAVQDLAAAPEAERVTLYGAAASDVAGEELAVGDLDNDLRFDVVIGSLQASGPGGPDSDRGQTTGRTYIVFAAASRLGDVIDLAAPGAGVTTIYGRRRGGISGDTLIVADMDRDGFDDLWDASPSLGTRNESGLYRPGAGDLDIIFGRPAWPPSIDLVLPADDLRLVQIHGADANDTFSYGMAVGDANGDGKLDVISNGMAGDGFEDQVLDAGEFYVLDNSILFDQEPDKPAPVLLNYDIQSILGAACLPCHAGEAPAAGLRLDIIQNSMVDLLGEDGQGRQSTQVDALLVAPGNPAASYLVEKLTAIEEPPRVGDRMPPPPLAPLPQRVIDDVRRWIQDGAPIANEELPPPPPPPIAPAMGFSTTFFARMHLVLADPALGMIESTLLDPPGPFPLRLIGPRIRVPAIEFERIHVPSGFGEVEIDVRQDGEGTIDRATGEIELSVTLVQIALNGAIEIPLPVDLTTGARAVGPFSTEGYPLDPVGGTLKLVGVATIPPDNPPVSGDPVLVELEGSVAPLVPAVPSLTDEIQPIFNASCALSNCHVGDGAGGLNLEAGAALGELVDVTSTQVEDLLVSPGMPEQSYLFEKVSAKPREGERMPIGNVLDPLDVEAIRQWIAGGAPE